MTQIVPHCWHAYSQHPPVARHKKLKSWLRAGKVVALREPDKVIAHIVPEGLPRRPQEPPDFSALRREIFGDLIIPAADIVIKERGRY